MFKDRTDAGEQLAELVQHEGVSADIVLAIPRGGLPIGRPVADALQAPLDVVVAKKLGAPRNPELAIGAVGADGSVWLNDALIERIGVDDTYVERERERKAEQARVKATQYRGNGPIPSLDGERVVVVDDGVATGATTIACLRQVRNAGADHVVLAVPVGSPSSIEQLRGEADDVMCLEAPPHFSAVGQFYRVFEQVPDEVARTYLREE
ncbi:Predicted phosphoribosyltransferase [Haladaptatus litoreus]|uniref:Predicted phosphoribosyltransferase n=1 Tax=Haladaptatus litoreus TaxID=553468 RepID=A0A1N7E6L2_9EURY|nr:phosphoribosyltransferase family protein [Haladaptatus litoreus]SIR83635.1 Predicted phosphoribosyltransferase [Haladaptatus litoreus]